MVTTTLPSRPYDKNASNAESARAGFAATTLWPGCSSWWSKDRDPATPTAPERAKSRSPPRRTAILLGAGAALAVAGAPAVKVQDDIAAKEGAALKECREATEAGA